VLALDVGAAVVEVAGVLEEFEVEAESDAFVPESLLLSLLFVSDFLLSPLLLSPDAPPAFLFP